jgi:hypothetical protein
MKTWAFAVSLLLFLSAGAAYVVVPQSTLPSTPSYYTTCTVNGQSGLVVVGCWGALVGPEPDGSYYVGAGLSFFSAQCNVPTWNPSGTFTWTGGNTTTGFTSSEHFLTPRSSYYAAWTLTNPDGSTAHGTVQITVGTGTDTFTNSYGTTPPTCTTTTTSTSTPTQTTTATSVTSTSTTQSKTIITSPPSSSGLGDNAIVSGVLVVIALVFLGIGFTGKGRLGAK